MLFQKLVHTLLPMFQSKVRQESIKKIKPYAYLMLNLIYGINLLDNMMFQVKVKQLCLCYLQKGKLSKSLLCCDMENQINEGPAQDFPPQTNNTNRQRGKNRRKICRLFVSQPKQFIGTHVVYWVSMIIYYVFTASIIFMQSFTTMYPLFAITLILNIIVQIFLILLGKTNPGKIPKIFSKFELASLTGIPYRSLAEHYRPMIYSVPIKTHTMRIKYCEDCEIYRPPRTSHCYDCHMCVERFDHHCPWVGTCIGKRNYVYYFSFVLSLTIQTALILTQTIYTVANIEISSKAGQFAINLILALLALGGFAFVATLLVFHIYLTYTNTTTNQFCKDIWIAMAGNPFSKSAIGRNCLKIFGNVNQDTFQSSSELVQRKVVAAGQSNEYNSNPANVNSTAIVRQEDISFQVMMNP